MKDTADIADWIQRHRCDDISGISLDDVIGLTNAKREVASLVARLRHPQAILDAGGDLPRGVLFYGAPGCGKTLCARAMASLLGQTSKVEFLSFAASDLDAKRFGDLSAWLADRPADGPLVVVYVDECDLWGRSRDDFRHSDKSRGTLLAALAAIDGLDGSSQNRVLWMLSSNKSPAELDAALTRPGRAGFHVRIPFPTQDEREAILRFYAARRRTDPDIDWARAAALAGVRTSPAGLKQALDDALALAIADGGPTATVTWRYVVEGITRGGEVDEAKPPSARERYERCVHESGHAVVASALGLPVVAMSLRRDGAVTEMSPPDEDDGSRDLDDNQALALIAVAMGGLAAEGLFGYHKLGGSSDIGSATSLAIARVLAGVDPGCRPVSYRHFEHAPSANDEAYQAVASTIATQRERAERIVAGRRPAIESLARALADAGHLSGAELRAAMVAAGLEAPASEDELAA